MIDWFKNEFHQGKTLLSYGLLRAGGLGFSFLIPIILAVYLTPEALGIYSLAMMVVYLFNSTTILSSSRPTVIFGIQELTKNQNIRRTITCRVIILCISLIIFILSILLLKNQMIRFTKLTEHQLWLLVPVFFGMIIENFVGSVLITLNQRIRESFFLLVTSGISIILLIITQYWWGITLERLFAILFISPVIAVCFFISKAEYEKIVPLVYDKDAFKQFLHYTRWMAMGGTSVYLLNWGDNIILRNLATMEEIGVYNLGYQFFKGQIMMLSVMRIYFLPFISQNIDNKEKIANYLTVKKEKLLFLGLLFSVFLFFAVPEFVSITYKGRYEESAIVFRILMIGELCALYSMFYDTIFDCLKKYTIIQVITALSVAVNLLLDYIFVSHIGFIGAAMATAISYFLLSCAKVFYFKKYCQPLIS
ncbi:MAG: polysaccharide biosynthesis C-terminal domain-containing protein [Desulfosalsimonadaceae bacterium]|nr:polysaccharide biosynthesis C-terminal domain-containing protein [Desulfosalsimonadaceae bacterium]